MRPTLERRAVLPVPTGFVGDIVRTAAAVFDVPVAGLMSRSHERWLARPRQAAMWVLRREAGLSLLIIGRLFGRDHTTVMHAVAQIERLRTADPALALLTDRLCTHCAELAMNRGERGFAPPPVVALAAGPAVPKRVAGVRMCAAPMCAGRPMRGYAWCWAHRAFHVEQSAGGRG